MADENEQEDPVADEAQLGEARREIADAVGRYADGWSSTEGAIVTHFGLVAEVACPDGDRRLLYVYADGAGAVGVPAWQTIGLLEVARDDLR